MKILKAHASSCPSCGFESSSLKRLKGAYSLLECLRCGLQWDPEASPSTAVSYEKSYYLGGNAEHGYQDYSRHMEVNRFTFRRRLKRIAKITGTKGKLLDVGCALGQCLIEAQALGWRELAGLEISQHAKTACEERGLNVVLSTLAKAALPKESFEVILLQDVLEHTLEVNATLTSAIRALKPGRATLSHHPGHAIAHRAPIRASLVSLQTQ